MNIQLCRLLFERSEIEHLAGCVVWQRAITPASTAN